MNLYNRKEPKEMVNSRISIENLSQQYLQLRIRYNCVKCESPQMEEGGWMNGSNRRQEIHV